MLAGFSGASPGAESEDAWLIETTLFAVVNNPEAFNGKTVRIGALARTSLHATTLYSSTSSKQGVVLRVPSELELAAAELIAESFNAESFSGERAVWANFTGRIEWRPGKRPTIILTLAEISGLKNWHSSSISSDR